MFLEDAFLKQLNEKSFANSCKMNDWEKRQASCYCILSSIACPKVIISSSFLYLTINAFSNLVCISSGAWEAHRNTGKTSP